MNGTMGRMSAAEESLKSLTCLELFGGAGGRALGLEQAGFIHRAVIEPDPHACLTLQMNWPWRIVQADIREITGNDFSGIDLVSGWLSSPERADAEQQGGFPQVARLIHEIRPRAVLLDGSKKLLAKSFAGYLDHVCSDLLEFGYDVHWKLIRASDYRVPQLRPRVVLVAMRRPWSQHLRLPEPMPVGPPTVGDILYDLMGEAGWPGVGDWCERAQRIAPTIISPGKRRGGSDLGPARAREAWKALGIDGMGIANEPPGPDFPADRLPRLTIRMVARIQGFPDLWMFPDPKTLAYREVSAAFPPPVAEAYGVAIREALLSSDSVGAGEPEIGCSPRLEKRNKTIGVLDSRATPSCAGQIEPLRPEHGISSTSGEHGSGMPGMGERTVKADQLDLPLTDPASRSESGKIKRRAGSVNSSNAELPARSSQESGKVLEKATELLLKKVFSADDSRVYESSDICPQDAGRQYGFDISLQYRLLGGPTARCRFECKNLRRAVELSDIADKIMQQQLYHSEIKVDHWVLVSPHCDPSNEVRLFLERSEDVGAYPFAIQVWSPRAGIRSLFALIPDQYEAIYGMRPTEAERATVERNVKLFRAKIYPRSMVVNSC